MAGGGAIAAPVFADVGVIKGVGNGSMIINGGTVDDSVERALAINGGTANAQLAMAMGFSAVASGEKSIAMGSSTTASGAASTAMGDSTIASEFASTAMGFSTQASGWTSTAMGHSTIASEFASTAMGFSTQASGWTSTAMGDATIASNFASTAMGYLTQASGGTSTAMGSSTIASGGASTAMGDSTTASGGAAVAMGYKTIASGGTSTAMGYATTASGGRSTSMGLSTIASGLASTAMGHLSEAQGENSLAASGGIAKEANTIAMGVGATAELENSIALGNGSVANTEAGILGYLGTDKTGAEWKSTANAISFGDAANNVSRQLTGLAAGTADTDAVNVAQLKALEIKIVGSKEAMNGEQLRTIANNTANYLGGGSTVSSNGTITAPTYSITDYATGTPVQHSDVGSALEHLDKNQNVMAKQINTVGGAVNRLQGDINQVRREAYAGTAAAMAIANLGQPYRPDQSAVSVSSAVYKGRVGYAVGASRITENGKFLLKGAAIGNNEGQFGGSVSATYFFD